MNVQKRPNGKWRARYRDNEGRQHAQHFATKRDAEAWARQRLAELDAGSYIDPDRGKVTFRAYAEQWRTVQVHRPGTAAQLETHLRRHVYPTLGDRPIGAIRRSELQAWVKGRADVVAPSTVVVMFRWVSSIFRAAVDDGAIRTSPCRGVKLPRKERKLVEPLDTDAVRTLVEHIAPRYRALLVVVAATGLRQGEAFGLTVDRVDFLRRVARIDRQLVTTVGEEPALAPPKTDASVRTIPLPRVAIDALAQHLETFGPGPDGLIFTDEDGGPIRRTAFSSVWRPAASAAGLPAGIGMHALRHYYASLLIRHGESVKTVQSRLGHASAAETLDTYSHLWPDSDDRTREAVDGVLGEWGPFGDSAAAR